MVENIGKKIKILFLVSTFNLTSPGRAIINLGKYLSRDKFECLICSLKEVDPITKQYVETQGYKLIELNGKCILNFLIILGLIKILKREKVDIIHNFGFGAELYGSLAARILSLKTVTTIVHNVKEDPILDYGFIKGYAMNFIRFIIAHFLTDILIAISHDAEKALLDLKFPKQKIKVIYVGIDFLTSHPKKIKDLKKEFFCLEDGKFYVGSVISLNKRKNPVCLLEAAKIINNRYPDIIFLIIGKGPLEVEMKNFIQRNRLNDCVIIKDFLENIEDFYEILNLFVLTSLTEGLPAVLLEAMAKGVPIIATKVGGVPEIIEDRISGILVPPKNPQALAEAIIELYENRELAKKLSENAKIRFEKFFTAENTAREYEKIYEELLKTKQCYQEK